MPKKTHTPMMVLLAILPILILIVLMWTAKVSFGVPLSDFNLWFEKFRHSAYAIPIIIATFIAGSFLSLPQWALFAGTIAVFGPVQGGALSWMATLMSGSVNFGVGRWLGYSRIERFVKVDSRIDTFLSRLRQNGFLASFAVRFVPTGPFIFVNMLAGASGLKFRAFIGGTALGIIPKILVVAFLAQGVIADENRWIVMLACALAACSVVAFIWLVRRKFKSAV